MKKYDLLSGFAWMTVGILFCKGSVGLGLENEGEPGPGFFPFLMSVCLIFFSVVHCLSFVKRVEGVNLRESERFWPETGSIKRMLFTVGSLFIFVVVINYLGFVLTTFFFMFVLLRFVEPQKWFVVVLASVLTTVLSYAVFKIWLKADLPAGFFGF